MSIDNFNTDELNIKDLVIEDASGKYVVPEWQVEIAPDEWSGIDDHIKNSRDKTTWYSVMYAAHAVHILDPDRISIKKFTESDYMDINLKLRSSKSGQVLNLGLAELGLAADAKCFFPDKDIAQDVGISPEFVISIIADNTRFPFDTAEGVIDYAILFPDKLDKLKETQIYETLKHNANDLNHIDAISSLTAIRLAFPDKYQMPDNAFFNSRRKGIEERKRRGNADFIKYAAYLKILAADDVKLTDKGVDITMSQKKYDSDDKSIPERRKF